MAPIRGGKMSMAQPAEGERLRIRKAGIPKKMSAAFMWSPAFDHSADEAAGSPGGFIRESVQFFNIKVVA